MSKRIEAVTSALISVCVAALAGCTSSNEPASSAIHALSLQLPTAGTRADPLKPAPANRLTQAQNQAQTAHRTDAKPGGSNLSMPWRFLSLFRGGRTILVSYIIGDPCDRPLGFRVEEGSNAVELTALSRVHHKGCEQSLIGGFGTIQLDRPLGHRLLLHAQTDRLSSRGL